MIELPPSPRQRASLLALVVLFVGIGTLHFAATSYFVQIMPPYLPAPVALVYVSGVFEILGGLGLLSPATRPFARWGLVALLVAVFPANVQMTIDHERWAAFGIPAWALYARLPLQAVLMFWVLRATREWRGDVNAPVAVRD